MKLLLATVAIILCIFPICWAQQDPDDPGIQDSLIVGETSIDSGVTFAFVQIFAVTDDSVAFYNLPLHWTSPGGGVYPGSGTLYFPPLTSWDEHFDTVVTSESYIRQIGFSDIGGDDNPTLFTNGQRLNAWNIRFVISPNALSQLVVLDTTWDSHNHSLILGLNDGVHEITPAFKRGYLGIGVGVDDNGSNRPNAFSLSQNYPNPFNPTTIIEFSIPQESQVRLVVYNLLGQNVRTLFDDVKEPGTYSVVWDGADDNGNPQSSGTYFYNLTTSDNSDSRRMTLIR